MADIKASGTSSSPLQRWQKPLRVHLSFIIVALLVAISIALLALAYRQGTRAALSAAKEHMDLLSDQTLGLYESVFRDGKAVVMIASVLRSLRDAPPADLEPKRRVLLKALQGSPHLDGVYAGYPDGAFIQMINVERNARWRQAVAAPEATAYAMRTILPSPGGQRMSAWRFLDASGSTIEERASEPTSYDPRERPWYKAAIGKPEPDSIGPYVSASTNSLTFSMLSGMEADPSIVFGADILLEGISAMLAEQKVSEHAKGYVFDEDGRLVVHSDPEVMEDIVEALSAPHAAGVMVIPSDPILPAVANLVKNATDDQEQLLEFRFGGEDYVARVARLGVADDALDRGVAVIAAPIDDFTGPSLRALNQTMAAAAALVTLAVLLSLLIARLISRALIELAADARRIGDLNFESRPRGHSWITEINMLASALASARSAIRTFALYVPRELVRKIVAAGQGDDAARQEVSVLFTDIKDFTTISEQLPPEDVVEMLGEYFQRLNQIVERNGGVIVQYLGDSIFAMWNAPIPNAGHADAACRCAIELKAAIGDMNAQRRTAGKPEFVTRIGLHTGEAVVGSVGAAERRQYTAMGDTVNVASRLEGLNKEFGTTILASAATRDACRETFQFRELGSAHAKGRIAGIEVFELVGGT
ncbi:MAG: adenylate/guanylate cyclase domain-containing protein [Rhizobiaceae bacterium]